jgi:hypothetical protein
MSIQRAGRGRCGQQSLDGVVFQDQVTCLDRTLMKNRSAMGLQRVIELSTISNGSITLAQYKAAHISAPHHT